MSQRSRWRLVVLQVLVLSLMLTLFGRLYYLQVIAGEDYQEQAAANRIREVITPANRGLILDNVGRPLALNRTSLVVSVDRTVMDDQKDDGEAVLKRLAKALDLKYQDVFDSIQLCGTKDAKPPPVCWNGSPYQPIPVAKDVETATALSIMERSETFPGVTAEVEAVREYPHADGANAAHVVGYLGPVTQKELDARKKKGDTAEQTALVGREGIEAVYDEYLRGTPGVQSLAVDQGGVVQGTVATTPADPGDYVVTNINAKAQAATEKALEDAIMRSRATKNRTGPGNYKADSGAAVVMEVETGRIIAMASYPTYDSNVWTGGVTKKELKDLYSAKKGTPLISRGVSGLYAPGSAFKVVSIAAAVQAGRPYYGSYPCPSTITVGNRDFSNFEFENLGTINMHTALEKSCDTIFYKFAFEEWLEDGGLNPVRKPADVFFETSKRWGFGTKTGIDLPSESPGLIADREYLKTRYQQMKDEWCSIGRGEVEGQNAMQRAIAAENCVDGAKLRAGDAVNVAIGQGDTLSTPLQVARTYAAIGNGGTLYQPQVARAIVSPDGKVVKEFAPKKNGSLGESKQLLDRITEGLDAVTVSGTAQQTFSSFPLDEIPVAGKTGTSEGKNAQPTAWFASFAPTNDPKYAVVVVINQGGTGGTAAAPAARDIFKALFGVKGMSVDPKRSVFPDGKMPTTLPKVRTSEAKNSTSSSGGRNGGDGS